MAKAKNKTMAEYGRKSGRIKGKSKVRGRADFYARIGALGGHATAKVRRKEARAAK